MKPKGTCAEIRKRLKDYTGRPLTGTEAEQVQDHLSRCPECRRLHEENSRIVEALRQDSPPDPGPDFWSRMTSSIMAEVRHLESRPQPWYRRPWFKPWSWPVYAWSPALILLLFTAGFYYYGSFSKPVFIAKNGVPVAESRLEEMSDSLADPFITLTPQESARLEKKMGRRLARELYARDDETEEAVLDWDLSNRMETLSINDLNKIADKLQAGIPAGPKEVTENVS